MNELASRSEIDKRVNRLLKEAGALHTYPTPVDEILAAQCLTQTSETESPLATGMIDRAPRALREKMEKIGFKILAILDRETRQVHLNPNTDNDSTNHERFSQLHEAGHDLCDWQDLPHFLDGKAQLSPETQVLFEREANYAAGQLLFQGDSFIEIVKSYDTSMATVVELANQHGGSIHAAFHQYVTAHPDCVAGFVLRRTTSRLPSGELVFTISRQFRSGKFAKTLMVPAHPPGYLDSRLWPGLDLAWSQLNGGQEFALGELQVHSSDGNTTMVPFEMFSNTYNLFLLIKADRRRILARSVEFAKATA